MKTIAIVLGTAIALFGCQRNRSDELERYLLERRAAAMTEAAETGVRMVAAMQAGTQTLTVTKSSSGRYVVRYDAKYCPAPGATEKVIEELAERNRAAEDPRLPLLKAAADVDESGFVTTAEGQRLFDLVQLAEEVNAIAKNEGHDLTVIAPAVGLTPGLLARELDDYRTFLARPAAKAAGLPELVL